MNVLDLLQRVLFHGLDLVHQSGVRDAQIARIAEATGVDLGIPETIQREVTPQMREQIVAARARYNEFEWLYPNGPRDQLCVKHHLTRLQVAGVLAGETKREANGGVQVNQDEPDAPAMADPPVAADSSAPPPEPTSARSGRRVATKLGITDDPATWPRRNGSTEVQPKTKKYDTDVTDWRIATAVLNAGRWEELRRKIGYIRVLSRQQVAGMKAVLSRGDSPLALQEEASD